MSKATAVNGQPQLHRRELRALPGRWIDLATEGVPDMELRARGHDPAVWSALVSVAMSAVNHGWPLHMYVDLLLDPRRQLGRQASLKNGKPRGRKPTVDLLHAAWEQALANIQRSPAHSADELQFAALRAIKEAAQMVSAQRSLLTHEERLVMDFVIDRLRQNKSTQTAISRQAFLDATGLGKTALGTAQKRLQSKSMLVLVEKGVPSGPNAARRRASVWAIPVHADRSPGSPTKHASNTGNRYVAPAPASGAPRSKDFNYPSQPKVGTGRPPAEEAHGDLADPKVCASVSDIRDLLEDLLDVVRQGIQSAPRKRQCHRRHRADGRPVSCLPSRLCDAPSPQRR
jgi:hypothetical protein